MKKLVLFICTIILFISVNVSALVTQSDKIYVTDSANILSDETEDYIVTYSDFIKVSNDIDFYVVTLDSLDNINLEDYTDYIFDSFSMNEKGLLIVVSKSDRTMRIKAGNTLSEIISNYIIDEYIESYFMPYLKNDDWDAGIKNGYSAFYKMLCNYYEIDSSPMIVYSGTDFINKYKYTIFIILLFICSFIVNKISSYLFNVKSTKTSPSILNDFVLVISAILNVYLLIIEYYLIPLGALIVLGFEIVIVIGKYGEYKDSKELSKNNKSKNYLNNKNMKINRKYKKINHKKDI